MKSLSNILFFFLLLYSSSFSLRAQVPDGSIAPDFTVVDIDGQSHNLYTYLNQGKTVIIEIASTWCFPCWSYLQIGALEDIHQIMGPEGLDNVVVLFVEAESRNSIEQLHGIQGSSGDGFADNTHGDWVSAIPYPIIDDASIGNLFQISSFPTIFKVCPNEKRIYEMDTNSTNQLLNILLNTDCLPVQYDNDIAILRYTGTTSICAAQENSLPIEIVNLGNSNVQQATISINDGHNVLSSTLWSGNLATYEREKILLDPVLVEDNIDLIFDIQCDTDANMHNNYINQFLTYAVESAGMEVNIEIFTDKYGFETYWELRSDDGIVYAKGGNEAVGPNGGGPPYINQPYGEGAYEGFEYVQRTVTLPLDGCYEFFIADDFGDGLCCSYGEGYFTVTDNHGKILVEGSKFADSATYPFSKIEAAATATTTPFDNANITLYPNPANDYLTIDWQQMESSNYSDFNMVIYNAMGQQVLKENFASNSLSHTKLVNLTSLPTGIYFLSLTNDEKHTYTTRFMVD